MDFKFSCPACAQHISAPEEMIGSEARCPTCGAAFTVPQRPPPPPATPPPRPTQAEMFADKIRALGYQLTIPPDAEDQDLETALDEFLFSEPPDFEGKFISMDEDETIKWGKRPTEKQLRAIGNEWLRQMLLPSGGEDFEEIVLRICPRIRA